MFTLYATISVNNRNWLGSFLSRYYFLGFTAFKETVSKPGLATLIGEEANPFENNMFEMNPAFHPP